MINYSYIQPQINYSNQMYNNLNNMPSNNILINSQNNFQSQIIIYQNQIKELKRELNYEKNKNTILKNENATLQNKIINLYNENASLKDKIKLLKNFLASKNIEQQKLLSDTILNNKITSIKPGEEIISVNFVSMGNNDIGHYSLICKNTDLFVRLEERLYEDFPEFKNYETYFEVNTKRIKRFKTIDENKIKSKDIINVFRVEDESENN